MRTTWRASCAIAFAVPLLSATPLGGITLDARRIGMGMALLPASGEAAIYNPGYLALPEERGARTIPLPLGLIPFLSDPPAFDPDDPEFDPYAVADLFLTPPLHLQLVSPTATGRNADILVEIAQDRIRVDLGSLREGIPREPLAPGLFDLRQPRGSWRRGGWMVGAAPLAVSRGRLAISPDLEEALAEAAPLAPDSRYSLEIAGWGLATLALQAGHGRRVPGLLTGPGRGLYVGATGKYLLGYAFADARTRLTLATGDPLVEPGTSPEADLTTEARWAYPRGGIGPLGRGAGIDVGAVMRWGAAEIGLGLLDAYTRMTWETTHAQWRLDETTGRMEEVLRAEGEEFSVAIPRTWTLSLAYRSSAAPVRPGASTAAPFTLAGDVLVRGGEPAFHVGGERPWGPIAVRGGWFTEGGSLQGSGGVGVPLGPIALDCALFTTGRHLSGGRGVSLATSLRLR